MISPPSRSDECRDSPRLSALALIACRARMADVVELRLEKSLAVAARSSRFTCARRVVQRADEVRRRSERKTRGKPSSRARRLRKASARCSRPTRLLTNADVRRRRMPATARRRRPAGRAGDPTSQGPVVTGYRRAQDRSLPDATFGAALLKEGFGCGHRSNGARSGHRVEPGSLRRFARRRADRS